MKDFTKLKAYDNHKVIIEINEPDANLYGFVAIHNDNLGSAVGGTRMYPYKSKKAALSDVLKLSAAMSYKCAIAGMPHGGGKGVIIGDPKKDKTKKLLAAYARKIDELQGAFHTGEDVGITEEDVQYMLTISPYFIGKKGQAGDPSPYASLSTYVAMKAAVKRIFGSDRLSEKTVAVKGVGKVGMELVRLLNEENARLYIADVDEQAILQAKKVAPDAEIVSHETIHKMEVDIYSPCALGNEITSKNCDSIRAKIICGSANNQLSNPSVGKCLYDRGVVYVPDYVANAGGLINVADELDSGGYNNERVESRIRAIQKTVEHLFDMSEELGEPLNVVADQLAEEMFTK